MNLNVRLFEPLHLYSWLTFMINVISQLPGFIAWKDKNFRYLGCNQNFSHVLGLNDPNQIIGRTDNELLDNPSEEILNFYRDNDKLALCGKTVKIIHSLGSHDENKSYYLEKKPLTNKNAIIGTIFHCHEFSKENILYSLKKFDKYHYPENLLPSVYQIEPYENAFHLSTREMECLFGILRGMTAKKISCILNLSKRTVEFYVENIKNKMGCHKKAELIDIAINNGYKNIIPSRFLNMDLRHLLS